jgi:hypothetical protein
MELNHKFDEHPLIYNPFVYSQCDGCGESINGSCYHCKKCSFDLHESCAKLPPELNHPIHRQHTLILIRKPPYEGETCSCSCCDLPCKWFIYHCELCKFNLDIKCATLPPELKAGIHRHKFILFPKSISFTCDVCGKIGKGMAYQCSICALWVHPNCTSSPLIVKHIRHKHSLIYTDFLEADQSNQRICQLCVDKVNTNFGSYYCSQCDFIAHFDCATDEEGKDERFSDESNDNESSTTMQKHKDSKPDELANKLYYVVKKIETGEEQNEIATEIEHIFHKHDLKLIDKLASKGICDGCIRPIFPPFYSCAQCDFFLHKSCVELPSKKVHLLHRHPLTLFKAPHMFECSGCAGLSNGFAYQCESCHFQLDVQCSSILDAELIHKGHDHKLVLPSIRNDEKCSACKSTSKIYRCVTCKFTLDFRCSMLPLTVKYGKHEHPFILSYTAEDDSGEYYCDICEEERDPMHWFYYCKDCNYPAHPQCIFGEFQNIKSGVSCTYYMHHHPLTLVCKTKDHPLCAECKKPCNDLAFECSTCNFILHGWCFHKDSIRDRLIRSVQRNLFRPK